MPLPTELDLPVCGHVRTVGGSTFVCVRLDHAWHSRSAHWVESNRRSSGKVVPADRHDYVGVPAGADPATVAATERAKMEALP